MRSFMNLNYDEIVDRIQTFHEVLKVTERRDKVCTSDEKNDLKDLIMGMDKEVYITFKDEHNQTKNMGSIEYQAYLASKKPPIAEVEEKVFYDGRRNNLRDFNLDQNSLNVLSSQSQGSKQKIDLYKDNTPSSINYKI